MTEAERQTARAALIEGLSLKQLIADLEGKSYGDLVDKHMREINSRLPATMAVHQELVAPEESDASLARVGEPRDLRVAAPLRELASTPYVRIAVPWTPHHLTRKRETDRGVERDDGVQEVRPGGGGVQMLPGHLRIQTPEPNATEHEVAEHLG